MVPIGSICAARWRWAMRGFAGSPGAHADAIALTDPVVLVVGGGGDVDLVEVVFDAAPSGDQRSRGGPAPGENRCGARGRDCPPQRMDSSPSRTWGHSSSQL